jgi:hypothetical protein
MDPLKSMLLAVSELRAQTAYMRDVCEDLAHGARLHAAFGPSYGQPLSLVDVDLGYDFRELYMPGHPEADARGYVRAEDAMQMTGTSPEAQAAYEACLQHAAELEQCVEAEEPIAQSA